MDSFCRSVGIAFVIKAMIYKPLGKKELALKIREVLDASLP